MKFQSLKTIAASLTTLEAEYRTSVTRRVLKAH